MIEKSEIICGTKDELWEYLQSEYRVSEKQDNVAKNLVDGGYCTLVGGKEQWEQSLENADGEPFLCIMMRFTSANNDNDSPAQQTSSRFPEIDLNVLNVWMQDVAKRNAKRLELAHHYAPLLRHKYDKLHPIEDIKEEGETC